MDWRYFSLLIENTIIRELRNRTLLFIFILTIIMIFVSNYFIDTQIFVGKKAAFIADEKLNAFYILISIWNGVLSTLLGVNVLKSDEEDGVLPLILSLPITRLQYLISRLIGSLTIAMAYYLVSMLLAMIIFSFTSGAIAFNGNIFFSLGMNSFTILGIITLTCFLSLFLGRIPSFVVAIIISISISYSNFYFRDLGIEASLEAMSLFKGVGAFIHYLLPRFGNIEYIARDLTRINPNYFLPIGKELMHFCITYFFLFGASYWILKKKNIQ